MMKAGRGPGPSQAREEATCAEVAGGRKSKEELHGRRPRFPAGGSRVRQEISCDADGSKHLQVSGLSVPAADGHFPGLPNLRGRVFSGAENRDPTSR